MHRLTMKLYCFSFCFAGLNKIFKECGVPAQTIKVGALLSSRRVSHEMLHQTCWTKLFWELISQKEVKQIRSPTNSVHYHVQREAF